VIAQRQVSHPVVDGEDEVAESPYAPERLDRAVLD
jgi:hypothetical protein